MLHPLPAPTVITWKDFLLHVKDHSEEVLSPSLDLRFSGYHNQPIAYAALTLFNKLSATEREMVCNDALENYQIIDFDDPEEFIDEEVMDDYMQDERCPREKAFIELCSRAVPHSIASLGI